MTSLMNPLERSQPTRATEVVSPELVLVDPQLALRARASLATPVRAVHSRSSAFAVRPQMSLVIAAEPSRERAPYDDLVARRRKQSAWLTVCVALGIVVAILLSDVRVELGHPSEAADRNAERADRVMPVRPSKPRSRDSQRPVSQAPSAATVRRFAWAPADGASGYRFELFRGSSMIFTAETSRPELLLPASWRIAGERQTLRGGEYRWYVWPLVAGARSPAAIVQASLVIPAR